MAKQNYLVLARKWRPQSFEDVVGQEHITRTLQNAIRSGRIGHAFLFIGTRGVGKTTTARILSKALNCTSTDGPTPEPCGECANCVSIASGANIDVAEIDGASNNSVEHVREIRENIRMVPSSSRYKIYIIDEVHQLSQAAFNALLKTLEEPPEHAIFILATTESHKVPATILSRCQRYDFRRVGVSGLIDLLRNILDAEGIRYSEEAVMAIARAADGSVRDGESILEQLISFCGDEITFQDVFDVLGLVDWQVLHELSDAMLRKDVGAQLRIVEEIVVSGKDLSQFVQDILRYFRNLLVCKTTDAKELLALPDEELQEMQERAAQFSLTTLIRLVEQFAELSKDFDSQLAQRIALEALLIRLSKVSVEMSVDAVLEKLTRLGAGGIAFDGAADSASGEGAEGGDGGVPPPNPERAAPGSAGPGQEAADSHQPAQERSEFEANVGESEEEFDAEAAATPSASGNGSNGKQSLQRAASEEGTEREGPPPRMTPDNADELWGDIAHAVGEENLNLGLKLAGARVECVNGGLLELVVPAGQAGVVDALQTASNREALLKVLQAHTENITDFSIHAREEGAASEEREAYGPDNRIGGNVPPEEARRVLNDPLVAAVVDVFKGSIVAVKRPNEAEAGS